MALRILVPCLVTVSTWPSVAYEQEDSSDSRHSPPAGTDDGKLPWMAATLSAGPAALGYGIAAASTLPSGHITSAQVACVVGGLTVGVLGPSAGHIYTGNYLRAGLFGMGRLAFAGMALAGLLSALDHPEADEGGYKNDKTEIWSLMLLGSAGVLGLTIWESVDSYYSAKAVNRERAGRALALSPFIVPSRGTGSPSATGLLVSGRF